MRGALIIIAGFALFALALWEVGLAFPVAWWLYAIVAVMFAAALLRRSSPLTQSGRLCALGIFWAAIATLYFAEWTSRKPFLRDLGRVRVGMTEADVLQIMSRYMRGTGWPTFPEDSSTNGAGTLTDAGSGAQHSTEASASGEMAIRNSLVFRHSNDGRFNSDWGIVSFSGGRVVSVAFSPD